MRGGSRSRAGTFGYKADVSQIQERWPDAVSRPSRSGDESRAADATASALKAHGIEDARVVAAR